MLVLIDADPIVYRCGFASETTSWHVIYENDKGEVDEIEFSPDEEHSAGELMREWLAFNEGRITVLDKSRVAKPDPVSYALRATQVQVESIIAECEEHYGKPGKMLMWISGKGGSYRDKIATVRPYKGNRDPTHKPYHYNAIRDYLRTQYGSFVTSGIEADDAVSIFAHNQLATGGDSYVVCTIDKDLDQIPGEHYNYMNKVFYAITQTEAERWFVYQLLAGDTTDNIPGVWKCGPAAAADILKRITFDEHVARGNDADAKHPQGVHTAGRTDRQPSKSVAKRLAIQRRATAATAATSDGVHPPAAAHSAAHVGELRAVDVSGDTGRSTASTDREYGEPSGDSQGGLRGQSDVSVRSVAGSGGSGECAEQGAGNVSAVGDVAATGRPKLSPRWWPTVVKHYALSQSRSGCPYSQDNPETVAIEMAQLVKLQEYPGQLWHPHGDLVVPGFAEENFDG